jgi:lipopolysaccharide transport system ATP-binding protein
LAPPPWHGQATHGFKKPEKALLMSSDDVAVKVNNLSKCYQIYDTPRARLKQFIVSLSQRIFEHSYKKYYREFFALKDVSLEVKKGECLGIIGRNGCGKSTLLQIIAGTLAPTAGSVKVGGKVAALLELGSGFNPEFTGRENVYMSGAIMGFSIKEMDKKFEEIAAFAEIGEFIDQPVKVYSSGMMVRLAFAVQTAVEPDILIVDEVLAVGDGVFVHRCMNRFHELRAAGMTVLFVSHDMTAMRLLTNNVLWLKDGRPEESGPTTGVVDSYLSFIGNQRVVQLNKSHQDVGTIASMAPQASLHSTTTTENVIPNIDKRLGDQSFAFLGIGIYNDKMNPIKSIRHGEFMILRATAINSSLTANTPCLFGFTIRSSRGIDIASANTEIANFTLPSPPPGQSITFSARFQLPLLHPDIYSLNVSFTYTIDGKRISSDHIANASQFEVTAVIKAHVLLAISVDYRIEDQSCDKSPTA